MGVTRTRPALGAMLFYAFACTAAFYFTFAAVQGDYGVFRRVQIHAEKEALLEERDRLADEVARMSNLTRRLSDDYLDLDLLDQQARDVLGLIRADEMVIP